MKDILKILGTWKFWKELFIMTAGMAITAAAVYYFLLPSKLVVGSITGLSIVIGNLLNAAGLTVKVSQVIVVINAILLLLAWILIGKEFGAKTVYTALILGPMVDMWEKILPIETLLEPGQMSLMNDAWFDLICFVLLLSIAQSVLFHINASTGGLDILAKIVNKYLHFDIGASVSIAGIIICLTALAINPFRMVVIGIIGTWINGIVLDYFTASINRKKRVCIISPQYEQLREYVVGTLHRGCSLYEVMGGYSGEKSMEVQVLLTQNEFSALMEHIREERINSFITAGNVSEVYGRWNAKKHEK